MVNFLHVCARLSSETEELCYPGVPIFLCNMAISGWIKFIAFQTGATLMTAIMAVGLVYLLITLTHWLVHLIKSVKSKSQASHVPTMQHCLSERVSEKY